MDDEKDLFIKNKLQEDKLISKKADDIFNKLNRGEFVMENNEKFNNENPTKENVINLKKNAPKWKKILATAASLVLIVGAANVYATSKGYENVFFLVKYLITGEGKVEGRDNILSDRDITISYEPINIEDGFNITINRLQIKDKVAKLFVITNARDEEKSNFIPVTFKVFNNKNEELCTQQSTRDDKNWGAITDELLLNGLKESDKIINLEVYKANSVKITTLIINLDEKTVEVQGEQEALQKISEIELKQFLGYVGGLSRKSEATDNETKIILANYMLKNKNKYELNKGWEIYSVEEVDKMLEYFIGEKIENFKNGKYIKTTNKGGKKYYTYVDPSDERFDSECINISNISYCNGLYTVDYSYFFRGVEGNEDIQMEYYDVYEQVVCIKLNDDNDYSRFRVISREEPTLIKKAIDRNKENNPEDTAPNEIATNTQTTNNTTNNDTNTSDEKVDNYASTMSWKEYWAPGIRFQYPTIFKLEEVGGDERGTYKNEGKVGTKISGIAKGIDPDTKARVDSDLEIRVYEPLYIDGDVTKYKYDENGMERAKFTTGNGLVWYESKEGEAGKKYIETYTHIEYFHDGTWTIFKIEFETNGEYNYKARNITNWIMGSTKITDF